MFKKEGNMKLAVIGSRNIKYLVIDGYIPDGVSEIVSGGAVGVDTLARDFAKRRGIKLIEFLPEYNLYGRQAPIRRNRQIAEYADEALAIWDGKSKGTAHTIRFFRELGKRVSVITLK